MSKEITITKILEEKREEIYNVLRADLKNPLKTLEIEAIIRQSIEKCLDENERYRDCLVNVICNLYPRGHLAVFKPFSAESTKNMIKMCEAVVYKSKTSSEIINKINNKGETDD